MITASPHRCNLCRIDCDSSVNLRCHSLGKRHRQKAGLPVLTFSQQRAILKREGYLKAYKSFSTPSSPSAPLTSATPVATSAAATATSAATVAKTKTTAQLYRLTEAQNVVPGIDQFGCLSDGDDIVEDSRLNDFDLSRLDDVERIKQREFDDAVVEVALFNYAQYHNLIPQTVKFSQVCATSAGIEGWASCLLQKNLAPRKDNTRNDDKGNLPTHTKRVKSDDQEARELQQALLESLGTTVATSHVRTLANLYSYGEEDGSEEDDENDDETTYEYEDDEHSENGNDEEKEDASSSGGEGDSDSVWSIVSHTSSSYALIEAPEWKKATTPGNVL